MRHLVRIAPLLVAVTAGIWSAGANAAVVYLDAFTVTRNKSTFYVDEFSGGGPPPSAQNFPNGDPASYGVFGTFAPDSEADGVLRLDSAAGGLTQNAPEQDRLTLRATLATSTDSSNLDTGLKIDDTLGLQGIFSLTAPTGPVINGYGIRFSDRNADGVSQLAELDVRFNPATGQVEVRYILQDFVANQITQYGLAEFAPPSGADQILLQITRPDTSNNYFFASYSYLAAGEEMGGGSFLNPISLFQGESFVRAEFHAFEALAVPEPGTLALLGIGLAGLAAVRRRKQ